MYSPISSTWELILRLPPCFVGVKLLTAAHLYYRFFVIPTLFLLAPFLFIAYGPYGYIKPFAAKADSVAAYGLQTLDKRLRGLKQEPEEIKDRVGNVDFASLRKTKEGKDYMVNTYSQEYKKCGGQGMMASVKATITTQLLMMSDSLVWLCSFLNEKTDETGKVAKKKKKKKKLAFSL